MKTLLSAPVASALFGGLLLSLFSFSIVSENGKAGYTNSPNEGNCTSCHSGTAVNAGGGSIAITISGLDVGNQYIAGQSYTVNVVVAQTGNPLFGFGCEALDSTGKSIGTLVVTNSAQTQLRNATVAANVRSNIVHKLNGGLSSNTHTFSFTWKAPATAVGTGKVTFHAAGVAANNNGSDSGDKVYTTSLALTALTVTNAVSPILSGAIALRAYPNPATDRINISYSLRQMATTTLRLVDAQGREVFARPAQQATGSQQESIDIARLAAGIYRVDVEIEGVHHYLPVQVL